ncbi:hypothetical protein HanHA300_Chr15g0551431 [Helianthus annuus]|nr:hypothetical protein HanHA300_Chr15g0551431 [Helianthus annuus]KAJ0471705.1 hypothetical protein HanHA89_Chr15g0599011 [Helianthus annuus]
MILSCVSSLLDERFSAFDALRNHNRMTYSVLKMQNVVVNDQFPKHSQMTYSVLKMQNVVVNDHFPNHNQMAYSALKMQNVVVKDYYFASLDELQTPNQQH